MTKNQTATGYALVTGGVGFIGTNLVQRLVQAGTDVVVFDNFSRPGVLNNARWLSANFGNKVRIARGDVRNADQVLEVVRGASQVFHFAAQVAVTTSLVDPVLDFSVNAQGTLNVLESIRKQARPPTLLYTSTNKVYGALPHVHLTKQARRYEPSDPELNAQGIAEDQQLDFHSPYGCSKGTADQYVLDYARSFGLPGVVFRMSCIYGPHQCGNEDQGWLAHFILCAQNQLGLTLYGDGLQVRDALFVDDLIDAMILARDRAPELAGHAFNMGGGPQNTTSLLEALERIERLTGKAPALSWQPERVGDQKYYVSNTAEFTSRTGWTAKVSLQDGLERLATWLRENPTVSNAELAPAARTPVTRSSSEPISA